MQARAIMFTAPRRVDIAPVVLPELADGEVLIRTVCSGISGGTELLAYRGEIDQELPLDETLESLGGTFSFPFQYGYSCVGQVAASAASSSEIPEGSLVFAFHPHQDWFTAGTDDIVPVDGIDPRVATLFPLVETALQITLDAGPRLGERVAVVGLGSVGLLVALLLQRAGAEVVAAEPLRWRREIAELLGVPAVEPGELAERLGGPVPLLVEVSGNPTALAGGLDLLAHEGTALVASWYGTKQVVLPLGGSFHRRRLTIRSTQVSSIPLRLAGRWTIQRRRAVARDLLGELPLAALVTHEFPFEETAEAFAAVDRGDEGLMHAALCYGERRWSGPHPPPPSPATRSAPPPRSAPST